MRLLVTGTDTEVGKTVVTAALVAAFRAAHGRLRVLKPVESGLPDDGVPADAGLLARCAGVPWQEANVYALLEPLAPALAARRQGVEIELERLDAAVRPDGPLVVEGVGGALVEVAAGLSVADLAARWQLPTVLVAGNRLGVLNHTLLTVEALQSRGVPVAVILNELTPEPGLPARTNADELRRLLPDGVPLLGSFPFEPSREPAALAWAGAPLLAAVRSWLGLAESGTESGDAPGSGDEPGVGSNLMSDDEQRFRDLLESQHSFPGPYTFKVICRNQTGTQEGIIAGIRQTTGLDVESSEAMRPSRNGKYVSFTLQLDANLPQDVLDVYRCLRSFESVLQYF